MSKTNKYVKSDLQICQKRPTHMSNEKLPAFLFCALHICQKRPALCQKRPAVISKETHRYVRRDLYTCQKRLAFLSKETYIYVKGDLHVFQKGPTYISKDYLHMSKENVFSKENSYPIQCQKRHLYICQKKLAFFQRDLHIRQRGPTYISKDYLHMSKENVFSKENCYPIPPILHLKCHSFNLILQSQSEWSFFSGTWQKRRRSLDHRLGFEIGEMTLQTQYIVHVQGDLYVSFHIHVKYRSLSIYMSKENYRSLFICNRLYMSKKICMSLFVYKRDL